MAQAIDIYIQARAGSTRLPGKALLPLCGKSMLGHIIERLKAVRGARQIILTTSTNVENDALAKEAEQYGIAVYRGSEENILDRFYHAAEQFDSEGIVRVTGDCPFVDPVLIDELIALYRQESYDMVSNIKERTFAHGLDVEVFSRNALVRAHGEVRALHHGDDQSFLETFHNPVNHIKQADWGTHYGVVQHPSQADVRLTVDYPADYTVAKAVYEGLYPTNPLFTTADVFHFLDEHPDVREQNKDHLVYS